MNQSRCDWGLHDWVNSPNMYMTNPPTFNRICKLCGKEETCTPFNIGLEEDYWAVKERFRVKREEKECKG